MFNHSHTTTNNNTNNDSHNDNTDNDNNNAAPRRSLRTGTRPTPWPSGQRKAANIIITNIIVYPYYDYYGYIYLCIIISSNMMININIVIIIKLLSLLAQGLRAASVDRSGLEGMLKSFEAVPGGKDPLL